MKFNLKKDHINRKVDMVLNMDPLDLLSKDFSSTILEDGSRYISLVYLTSKILSEYDIEYEYSTDGLEIDEIDYVSFVSKSYNVLLKMPKDYDLNCSFDSVDYGIIVNSKISFAQRNDMDDVFKTGHYCCYSPIDMIVAKMMCDEML